jgi:AcrR family transcriptional regulator
MESKPRTQSERSAATKDALVNAARPLFAAHGFGSVGTEAIVRAAGVTRGAMYHQFADKVDLFAAVFEAVEADLTKRLDVLVTNAAETDPIALMELGSNAWLDAALDPEVAQIALIDGPAVLGWERWREIGMRYGMGLVEGLISYAIASGRIEQQPAKPLAHVFLGALDEAALYVARAADQPQANAEMRFVINRLIAALAT